MHLALLGVLFGGLALAPRPAVQADQTAPADEADTYAVYSTLLNDIPPGQQPVRSWMFETTASTLPADSPCVPPDPPPSDAVLEGNAHLDIHPPEDQLKRFREMLDDFDQHCHDTFRLRASLFKTAKPVRILTEKEAARFFEDLAEGDPKTIERHWPGAGGLRSFGRVFFTSDHSAAMVHESVYCGVLCGSWQWQVLERTATGWRVLRWGR